MPSSIRKAVADIKSQLLNPALTSHFQCYFQPPPLVVDWMRQQSDAGVGFPYNEEFISISCMDASLPGSSLMTHEQTNDFHGITERHAYRRDYGSGVDFTFIVDSNHNIIFFFESWLRYIVNERVAVDENYPSITNSAMSYSRVNYPRNYRSPGGLYIHKFERDYEASSPIVYQFFNAYPTSISSMPVSYEASQLLKCTITFTYTRYMVSRGTLPSISPQNNTALPAGVTNTVGTSGAYSQDKLIWALSNQGMINSVGTKEQRNILSVALASDRNSLRTSALNGTYTTTDRVRGIVTGEGRPIPRNLINF
jgi:hypothetical protein